MAQCPISSAYEPSALVTAFHNIPHIDINLNQNVTEFENTLDYYETIIIWACVPILAAICLFILMSVYFICVCCCCCCQQHEERSKVSKGICGILVMLLILLGVGCGGAALWAEFALDGSIQSANTAAMNANSLVQDVRTDAALLDFDTVDQEVMDLSQAVTGSDNTLPGYDQAVAAVTMLEEEIPTLRTAFMEIQSNADINDFSTTLDAIDLVELIRHWVVVGYVIVSIIVLLLMALSVFCTPVCNSPACMIVALVFLGLYTLTMWVAVGGNLGYLIIAGDVCSDPDQLVREQFSNGGTVGNLPAGHLSYYLVCNETCYPNPFSEFQTSAEQAQANITTQQMNVAAFASNNNLANVQMALDTFVTSFDTSVSAIMNITTLTNCTQLNTFYLQVLDGEGLCQDGYQYSLILFAMACGLALVMFLLLCCGSFYAGLFTKGRTFDDETIVYDFPNEDGPTPWQSYGTQQRYHNTTQSQYTGYNDSFQMSTISQNQPSAPGVEPPKYTDLATTNGVEMPASYNS